MDQSNRMVCVPAGGFLQARCGPSESIEEISRVDRGASLCGEKLQCIAAIRGGAQSSRRGTDSQQSA